MYVCVCGGQDHCHTESRLFSSPYLPRQSPSVRQFIALRHFESDSNGKWRRGCPLAFPPKASNLKTSRRRHRLVEAREATRIRGFLLSSYSLPSRRSDLKQLRERQEKNFQCQKTIPVVFLTKKIHKSIGIIIQKIIYNFPNEFVVPKKDDTTG